MKKEECMTYTVPYYESSTNDLDNKHLCVEVDYASVQDIYEEIETYTINFYINSKD